MASSEGSNDGNAIQLDTMSLDQLDQLKQREESRLQALSARYAQLRQVAARLTASQTAVQELAAPASSSSSDDIMDTDTKEVFVPLTESVYVPGKIKTAATTNDKDLLVELGTGYYVEKSSGETVEFLDRKIKIVDANSENVTQAIQSTRQNLEAIAMAMRGKMLEIQARQQGTKYRASVEGN